MTKTYSKNGISLTKQSESCELEAYPDPGTKDDPDPLKRGIPWTIGYGHTKGVYTGMTCTPEQAEDWLVEDIASSIKTVNDLVKVELSQNQFDALVDFAFNVGRGNFLKSELLQKLNEGRYSEVDDELKEWNLAGGKVMGGLVKRRQREADLFDDEEPDSI
jgi:lysozyme